MTVKYTDAFNATKELILATNDWLQDFIDTRLTITNKDELQERFYEIINEFSYAGIKNSNGLLELE